MPPTRLEENRACSCADGVRQQRRGPVFVGDAEPAVGDLEGLQLVFVDFLVAVFLQALVAEIADQAFVQDVIALDMRRAVPRDQRERIQRHRRVADIGDLVLDGEQIALVDRNGAAEGEAFAIVIFQRHRAVRREVARAFLLPQRVLVGNPHRRAGSGDPAEFRVIGFLGARRREQHDRRRFGIDGVAELHQRQIVDARALQGNAAADPRGFDLDARVGAIAASRLTTSGADAAVRRCGRRRGRRAGLRGGRGGGRRCPGLRRGLRRLALGLLRALLFHLRNIEEILPADQHEAGQNDGEDGVAIIGHRSRSRHSIRFAAGAGVSCRVS